MADISVIVEGVDSELSKKGLYSTVHGAGRIMSRTQNLLYLIHEDFFEGNDLFTVKVAIVFYRGFIGIEELRLTSYSQSSCRSTRSNISLAAAPPSKGMA